MAARVLSLWKQISKQSRLHLSTKKFITTKKLTQSRKLFHILRDDKCKSDLAAKEAKIDGDAECKGTTQCQDMQIPTTVRSTLPINILQTTAAPEESMLSEDIVLGPNQKLAVPWPSFSEKVVLKKPRAIVYPATLPAPEASSKLPQREALHASSDVQKRGISRLRHMPYEKEAVNSVYRKGNTVKKDGGCRKILSGLDNISLARYSSSSRSKLRGKQKKRGTEEKDICNVSIKKKFPKRKSLPILVAPDCPCSESEPLRDVRIKKLKPRYKVRDPPRICREALDPCKDVIRADDGLEIKRKELPRIVPGDCPCTEEQMKPGKKLVRLKFRKVKEPERICPSETLCEDMPRSDKDDWEYTYPDSCKGIRRK